MELAKGIEPSTCWLQVSCSTIEPRQQAKFFGGQGWIRTIEDIVDGFTVRCIWPLCNLPMCSASSAQPLRDFIKITSTLSPLCFAFKKWQAFFEVSLRECYLDLLKILVSIHSLRLGLLCILSYTGAEARIEPPTRRSVHKPHCSANYPNLLPLIGFALAFPKNDKQDRKSVV